ncbi:MAG: C40 family peptidase [Actinomycetota bacterium]
MRPHRLHRLLALSLALGLIGAATPAFAKTPKPTLAQIQAAKKAEEGKRAAAHMASAKLAQATEALHALTAKAESTHAKYVKAQKELSAATRVANVANLHARKTSIAVSAAHKTIGLLASNAYIMGGGFTDIEPLLSSRGPQDLVDRLSILSTLGASNSTALDRYKAAEVVASSAKKAANKAKLAQQRATARVATAKKAADRARAAQQVEVQKLQAVQDALMKELESAKKVRTTLEQQRQLALLEEAAAARAAQTPGQKSVWPDLGFKGRLTTRATQKQRLIAVAYAKKQVLARKPYVWGAQGPNSYDCSGLVYAAYKAAGLGWPAWDRLNAALYSVATMHVAFKDLQPGDLLFYSYNGTVSNIHHITIYAGEGMMWEANSRSRGLLFSNMYSIKGLMPFGGRV